MSTQSMDQKFTVLTRDIDWQRASFLCNSLEIVRPPNDGPNSNSPAEIIVRGILDHYLLLSLLFYRQLRGDLKQQFKAGKLRGEDVKISLQRGLDKLVQEWDRIFAVISSVRASHSAGKARELMRTVHPLQHTARTDAYLTDEFQTVLHFNQDYSMRFFNYIENVAALNMPLGAVDSPWEWSIVWHEFAHEKIRSLKKEHPDYFDAMLTDTVKQAAVATPAQIRRLGWSADWLEEMFADSFSVANFPLHFLYVLKYQLQRYAEGGNYGSTHPIIAIRLATAMFFHLQRKQIALPMKPGLQSWKPQQWRSTWSELNDPAEKTPQRFAEFDPGSLLRNPKLGQKEKSIHLAMARTAARRMLDWHQEQSGADHRPSSVRDLIAWAMQQYTYGTQRDEIISHVREGVSALDESSVEYTGQYASDQRLMTIEDVVTSKTLYDKNTVLDSLEMEYQGVARLLRARKDPARKLGYLELLALEFDEDDYDKSSVAVTNVQVLSSSKWTIKFPNAVLVAPIANAGKGDVMFKHPDSADKFQVSTVNWNKAAKKPDYQIGK